MEQGLFSEKIGNWQDWGRVYQSIAAFAPLVGGIMRRENLPCAKIENLTPGTNAVFKVGNYVVKVFAPAQSGIDQTLDLQTELFGAERAGRTGVCAPKMLAHGFVRDKYRFAYMITEHIDGISFTQAVKGMTRAEKIAVGRKLRGITDRMNTPCESFNGIDVINDEDRHMRWEKYPARFKAQRLAHIGSARYGPKVFVHGDLCGDNVLLTAQGDLFIIDFADAVLAPRDYEHALVAVELFDLDPALLRGYFGGCTADELAKLCFDGLLIHDFGADIVKQHIGEPDEFWELDELRKKIRGRIPADERAVP